MRNYLTLLNYFIFTHYKVRISLNYATENSKLTSGTAREAITIIQGEMLGYYRNARREDYGLNVKGPDFLVEGPGEFENITHVEVKNPVGSAIKLANGQKGNIGKQGKKNLSKNCISTKLLVK